MAKQIRRNRIHNILNGIRPSSYREISKIPLDQREYSKPQGDFTVHFNHFLCLVICWQGSGTKKRWDLVRFALFGNDGPRIKSKPRMKGVKPSAETMNQLVIVLQLDRSTKKQSRKRRRHARDTSPGVVNWLLLSDCWIRRQRRDSFRG